MFLKSLRDLSRCLIEESLTYINVSNIINKTSLLVNFSLVSLELSSLVGGHESCRIIRHRIGDPAAGASVAGKKVYRRGSLAAGIDISLLKIANKVVSLMGGPHSAMHSIIDSHSMAPGSIISARKNFSLDVAEIY